MSFFMFFSLLSLILASLYLWLIFWLVKSWKFAPYTQIEKEFQASTFFSVIIPVRNEEHNIKACIKAILQQNYPADLFEVLVVDDHSADDTAACVLQFSAPNLHLLHLGDYPDLNPEAGYKKQAIHWAIQHAKGKILVTTDGDCIVPPNWLRYYAFCFQRKSARFVAAPVSFHQEGNLLERFQSLDFLGMMVITGAGIQTNAIHMCNGANLAYSKASYEAVNGFHGIDHLASGDDLLLMHKIARQFPKDIYFIKSASATVYTRAKPSLQTFISQRLRWATKSNQYPQWKITAALALVFLLCWTILICLPAVFLWGWPVLFLGLLLFGIKSLADFYLLKTAILFFNRPDLLLGFFPAQIIHILYIAGIGLLANMKKKYVWKGRKVS